MYHINIIRHELDFMQVMLVEKIKDSCKQFNTILINTYIANKYVCYVLSMHTSSVIDNITTSIYSK